MTTHRPLLVYYNLIHNQVGLLKSMTGQELMEWRGRMDIARKATLRVWKTDLSKIPSDLTRIGFIRKQKQALLNISMDLERIVTRFRLQPVSMNTKRILHLCSIIGKELTELENELKSSEKKLHLAAMAAL